MESFCFARLDEISIRTQFRTLISELSKNYGIFQKPVIQEWPSLAKQYLKIVKFPVSLSEIAAKCPSCEGGYVFCGEILRDLELVAANCEAFNQRDSDFFREAQRFRRAWFLRTTELAVAKDFSFEGTVRDLCLVLEKHFPPGATPRVPHDALGARAAHRPSNSELSRLRGWLEKMPLATMRECVEFLTKLSGEPHRAVTSEVSIFFSDDSLPIFWQFFDEVKARFDAARPAKAAASAPPPRD
eukprot:gnl/Chilomastix_cuspidata/4215.p2 GENE.gnl/Chilomastix_cuspidata/4215~~gnl/Chilomastix_cuspidata/4215.p2  ORF type:complete len:243 (+),score=94.96 gnl/Chilomastix_cuspidata/4215:259-987(+)